MTTAISDDDETISSNIHVSYQCRHNRIHSGYIMYNNPGTLSDLVPRYLPPPSIALHFISLPPCLLLDALLLLSQVSPCRLTYLSILHPLALSLLVLYDLPLQPRILLIYFPCFATAQVRYTGSYLRRDSGDSANNCRVVVIAITRESDSHCFRTLLHIATAKDVTVF